jgi:hypothetical protein
LIKILHLTPLDRLQKACGNNTRYKKIYNEILNDYLWFLDNTGKEHKDVIQWIGNRRNRDRAFERGRKFGEKVYTLLSDVSDPKDLRYLII